MLKPNPTQREMVVAYIETHGSITVKQAYKLGITQLAARVFELKKLKYVFDTPTIKVIDGWGKEKTVTKYSIESYPTKPLAEILVDPNAPPQTEILLENEQKLNLTDYPD